MKVSTVIKKWLKNRINQQNFYVKSSDVETDLVWYAKEYWGVLHTPSTYSRAWRKLREKRDFDDIDIKSIKPIKLKSKQKTWIIETTY
jgi:hypothetical protein